MDSQPTFSSDELRQLGDYPLGMMIAGRRFTSIKIRLTMADYLSTRVQDWLKQSVFTRGSDPRNFRIYMEIV